MKTRSWAVLLSSAVVCVVLAAPARGYEINRKKNEVTLSSLEDFEKCMRDFGNYQADFCSDGLNKFAKSHKKQAFEAGKLARLHLKHWAALPLFDVALASGMDRKTFCADKDVHLAAISGLALPPGRKEEDRMIRIAQKISIDTCWDSMKEAVNKEADGVTGYLHDNVCNTFKKKKIDQKYCNVAPAVAENKPAEPDPEIMNLPKTDLSKLEVAEGGVKVFRGEEGRKITIVQVQPESSNKVLIKFEGFKGPWNNKAVLHIVRDMGNNKADYVTNVDGQEWVSVVKRNAWGSASYEVYPKGDRGDYRVAYSEEYSGKASANDVLKTARKLASE